MEKLFEDGYQKIEYGNNDDLLTGKRGGNREREGEIQNRLHAE